MVYDVAIVGAGLVGLGTALQLLRQRPGLRVVIIDKADKVAAHQSGNNSGVIHSGIYYKPGSLRASLCRRGYTQLLQFCDEQSVPYQLCGKVIVAVREEECNRLGGIYERGQANGLQGLRWLRSREAIREIEPHVGGLQAIYVPQAGIVDYKRVAAAYADAITKLGGEFRLNTRVLDIVAADSGRLLLTDQGDIHTRLLVSCGGLYADHLSRMTEERVAEQILPFRGEYYKLTAAAEHLVQGLIYPVPNPNFPFLGVHFTRLAGGGVEAGPNAVLAFAREGYKRSTIHWRELAETLAFPGFRKLARKYWRDGLAEMYRSFSKAAFLSALQPLVPAIRMEPLEEGGAGVRAMACSPDGSLLDDFLFYQGAGVIHVANAPSPAATASLAIGETVAEMVVAAL